jgi:hypothetical protein
VSDPEVRDLRLRLPKRRRKANYLLRRLWSSSRICADSWSPDSISGFVTGSVRDHGEKQSEISPQCEQRVPDFFLGLLKPTDRGDLIVEFADELRIEENSPALVHRRGAEAVHTRVSLVRPPADHCVGRGTQCFVKRLLGQSAARRRQGKNFHLTIPSTTLRNESCRCCLLKRRRQRFFPRHRLSFGALPPPLNIRWARLLFSFDWQKSASSPPNPCR